jgi:hypothetical protein
MDENLILCSRFILWLVRAIKILIRVPSRVGSTATTAAAGACVISQFGLSVCVSINYLALLSMCGLCFMPQIVIHPKLKRAKKESDHKLSLPYLFIV